MQELYHYIKNQANKIGFDLCGIAPVTECNESQRYLSAWIDKGYNGTMGWMGQHGELRQDITLLLPGARSVIVCALSYLSFVENNRVSQYAQGVDYHYIIKKMLSQLASDISLHIGAEFNFRIFCDSAPLFERLWAERANIGWIGRNNLVISKEFGSYILIGELVCDVEVDHYDANDNKNGCAKCCRCQEVCPGNAFREDGFDVRRCASYLTIEHSGDFDASQREIVDRSGYVFGCDICLDVCPWNKKAKKNLTPQKAKKVTDIFSVEDIYIPKTTVEWQKLIESGFKQNFKTSPILRAGKKKIARNLDLA